jgi:hypothetical protein
MSDNTVNTPWEAQQTDSAMDTASLGANRPFQRYDDSRYLSGRMAFIGETEFLVGGGIGCRVWNLRGAHYGE